jgi:cytoskeletal protein CcmA (bactofilin family)
MSWFGRSPRPRGTQFEDRPSLIREPLAESERAMVDSSADELAAYLYKGSRVTGQLTFHGPARIDGSVDGEILCHGQLTVGEDAEIRAKISGDVVVIHGQVEGDVTATEKIELGAPARLLGNIVAPRLVIAEGVAFDGGCAMSGVKEKRAIANPLGSISEAFEGGSPKLVTTLEK